MALSGLDYKLIDVVVHFKESLPTKPIAPSLPSSHILSSGVCKINEYGETEAVKYKQGQKHFTPEEIAHMLQNTN